MPIRDATRCRRCSRRSCSSSITSNTISTGAACGPRGSWKRTIAISFSFDGDVFGGPQWRDLVGAEKADEYVATGAVPVMLDPEGFPVKRNFVHVDDLVSAILLAIDHPKAPADLQHLHERARRLRSILCASGRITRFAYGPDCTPYHSTWLDNTKARFLLGWRPRYDFKKMTDSAWEYERAPDDPRIVWYPG